MHFPMKFVLVWQLHVHLNYNIVIIISANKFGICSMSWYKRMTNFQENNLMICIQMYVKDWYWHDYKYCSDKNLAMWPRNQISMIKHIG